MAKDSDHPYYNTDEHHDWWIKKEIVKGNSKNVMEFRDNNFVSMYTRQPSIPWDRKWFDEFYTFTLKEYLERCRNLEGNQTDIEK